jgi:hypothetical protein
MILGYNWLRNHNPEINWQTKEVKMSRCPTQCSTFRVKTKRKAIAHKATISRINACRAGAFPSMIEELDDQDEATHVNANETEEEAQGECPAFDDNLKFDADHIEIEEGDRVFMAMFTRSILNISCVLRVRCPDVWPKPPRRTQRQRDSMKSFPQHSTPMRMCSAKQLSTLSLNVENGTTPSNWNASHHLVFEKSI